MIDCRAIFPSYSNSYKDVAVDGRQSDALLPNGSIGSRPHNGVCTANFYSSLMRSLKCCIVEKSCLLASVASAQGSFGLTRIRHVLKRECHVLKVGSEASVLKSFNRFHRRSIFTVQHIRRQQHHPRSPTSRSRIKDARQHSSREQGSDQHLLALDG